MNIIRSLPPKLEKNDWVAIDLELYGADEKILHRPTTGKFACLSFCALSNPDDVYIVDDETLVQTALDNVNDATWVIHHAKFDITHLRRWAHIPPRKKLWDTYLIEKILWSGYYDKFGLGDLVRRYLSIHLDKSLQKEWGKMNELSDESLEYAAHDVFYGLRVCLEQRNIITKELLYVWKKIDLPVLWAVLDFKGFAINVDKWNEIAPRNKQLQLDADAQLDFNPRSHEKARLRLVEAGFPKLPNVQRPTLEKWIKKYPDTEAARLARIMILSSIHGKRASTYGEKFVSDHVEKEDGVDVILCDYNVIGAESGRFSSSSPNMQNIPSRETSEFRECFIARPGNKLIVVDFTQQEIGIVAYIAGDERMLEIFNSGQDIYIQMAKLVHKKDITKDDPLRKQMKSVVLGLDYGMSAHGLADKEEIELEEAQEIMDKFFETFPTLKKWMLGQEKVKDKVYTIMGRRIYLNPYSGQCDRNAKNFPIQGSAADMMKITLARVFQEWKWDYPFAVVATVHDETVLDVPEAIAQEVADFVASISSEVANTMCNQIPMNFMVTVSICDNWSEKE